MYFVLLYQNSYKQYLGTMIILYAKCCYMKIERYNSILIIFERSISQSITNNI